MKRTLLLIIALTMMSVSVIYASEQKTDADKPAATEEATTAQATELILEETASVEKCLDITYLGCVADDIAMSIPAYVRDEEETVETPEARALNGDHWNNRTRYKYKKNGESNPYADMYVAIGAALKPQSDEYKLLDIRMNILNTSITPLDLEERAQALLTYADDYEFELAYIMTEVSDTLGNKNEWLTDNIEIPVLVEKTVHFIFEVPNVVATDTKPLSAELNIADNLFRINIR